MNTRELVFHLCDNQNSINWITSFLTLCGHDYGEVVEVLQEICDTDVPRRWLRVGRAWTDDNGVLQEVGLDELVLDARGLTS